MAGRTRYLSAFLTPVKGSACRNGGGIEWSSAAFVVPNGPPQLVHGCLYLCIIRILRREGSDCRIPRAEPAVESQRGDAEREQDHEDRRNGSRGHVRCPQELPAATGAGRDRAG